MRILLASLLLLSVPLSCLAEEVTSILAADGKTIDSQKVLQFAEWVQPAIGQYPTSFKNDAERKSITEATSKVTNEILKMDVSKMTDAEMLTSLGYLLAMGHNVDLQTAQKARECFDRALTLAPDNRRANWLYGSFLAETSAWHYDSMPYLEKALGLGERGAQFTLAMLYYQKGEKNKAIDALTSYTFAVNDLKAERILTAMKGGELDFGSVPTGGTPPKVGDKAPDAK